MGSSVGGVRLGDCGGRPAETREGSPAALAQPTATVEASVQEIACVKSLLEGPGRQEPPSVAVGISTSMQGVSGAQQSPL